MSGLWCVNIGYGRRELAEAAAKQMAELPYYNSFFQCATPPAIELPNLWHRLRRLDLIAYFSPAPVPKPTIRSYAWCGDTGNCAGSPSARLSYRATTLITAAQWRGLRWAAWRPCTRKAVCPYRTSPTSGSRIGLAKGVHTRRMNLV